MKTAHSISVVVVSCLATTLTLSLATKIISVSIVGDLWNYPARTFSQIDILAQRALGQPGKVLSDATVTATDYTSQPIVTIDTNQPPDLTFKINSTEEEVDQLYLHYQRVSGEAVLMGLKWDTLTVSDITRSSDELIAILGDNKQVEWLTQAWGWPQLDTVAISENEVRTDLAALRSIVSTSGTLPVAYTQLKSAITSLSQVTKIIGEKTDTAEQTTIYGRYQKVRAEAGDWDSLKGQLEQELASGDLANHAELEARVLELNQIPHVNQVLSLSGNNRLSDLIALTDANKLFLAGDRGSVLAITWLEVNPVVFKTLVANTSPLTRQELDLKYYLPAELKELDIVAHDAAVEVKFDPDKKRLLVSGHVTVAAGDTKTISVETADVWRFDSQLADKASFQAAELTKALAGSAWEVDAIALKSSVDASIKKVTELQNQRSSASKRIEAFRQISMEMGNVNLNLAQLRQLVSTANSKPGWEARVPWVQIVAGLGALALMALGIKKLKRPAAVVSRPWPKTAPTRQFHTFAKDVTSSDL